MHPNPVHLPIPPNLPLALAISPPKRKKNLIMEVAVCYAVSQYTLLPKQLYLEMFIAVSHWTGLRALASATLTILDPYQNFSWILC